MTGYWGLPAGKRPYFHSIPLFWPTACALAGSTLANARLGAVVLASSVALSLISTILGSSRRGSGAGRPAGFGETAGLSIRYMQVAIVLAACFAAGTLRGVHWASKWAAVEEAGSRGPSSAVLIPLETPKPTSYGGRATFRARIYGTTVPEGTGVEATIYAADAGLVRPGKPVSAYGRLTLPEQSMNPGDFDRRRYLASDRVFGVLECSRIEAVQDSSQSGVAPLPDRAIASALEGFRRYVGGSIDGALPPPEASVLKGILLSDRTGLPDGLSADFRRSGFYRFATIAGFHVDAVFAMTERSLRRLTRRPTAARVAAVCISTFYAALSGWSPGALRALTCAAMRSFAPAVRRRYYPLAGLCAAALLSCWVTPFPLTDAGFQLSFAGALGGFAAARFISWPTKGWRTRLLLGAARTTALALALVPVMALSFSDFALAGFVLGGVWTVTVTALIPISVALLVPGIGTAAGWLPYLLLKGVAAVSAAAASIEGAALVVPAPSFPETAAYYGLLLLAAGAAEHRLRSIAYGYPRRHRSYAPPALALSAALFACALCRALAPWPIATFISVGQADCAVLRYRGIVVMVDTGTSGGFSRSVSRFLRRQGVTRVDLCILSHLHQDHAGGLALLCSEVPVGALLVPPGSSAEVADLLPSSGSVSGRERSPIPEILEAKPGAAYIIGELEVTTLCEPAGRVRGDGNETTVVAVVRPTSGGEGVFEFWGDAPGEAAEAYIRDYPLLQDGQGFRVVKVPHHGSRDSLAPGFYDRLDRGVAVISVGTNSYGHPSKEVLEAADRSSALLRRTDRDGAVTVLLTPLGGAVRAYR